MRATASASPSGPRYILDVRQLRHRHREGVRGADAAAGARGGSEAACRVDRELLLEIGCEEIPASWLPGADQRGWRGAGRRSCSEQRLPPEAPAETFSTPRRLTVRIARLAGAADRSRGARQRAARRRPASSADGTPTPAAAGFASKQGVEVVGARAHRDAEGRVSRVSASGSAARPRSTSCPTCSAARCAR